MPICIECCYPVSQLYHILHSRNHKATAPPVSHPTQNKSFSKVPKVAATKAKATNTGAGGDVRLTQCPRCKRFADKYVEHDFVVLFIDLVLVKPQVSQVGLGKEAGIHKKTSLLTSIYPQPCWQSLGVLKADGLLGLQTPSVQSSLS